MIEWHITQYGTASTLNKVPEGATIDTINNKDVLGCCEHCTRPILEDEEYISDINGVMICDLCNKGFDHVLLYQ